MSTERKNRRSMTFLVTLPADAGAVVKRLASVRCSSAPQVIREIVVTHFREQGELAAVAIEATR